MNEQIVRVARAMDGTCSGEHSVGLHKMGFLKEEISAHGLQLIRAVKQVFDPQGLLNPGKIFC